LVWDGDSGCEHEWVDTNVKWHGDRGGGKSKEVFDDSFQVNGTQSGFCSLCGAWKGSLGLEPSFGDVEIEMMELRDDLTPDQLKEIMDYFGDDNYAENT